MTEAVTILPARAIARVSGEAPLSFLHATLSQDVEHLAPGSGALACLLDEKGRVQAELRVLALRDGSVLLDGEEACAPGLEYLARVAPLSGCSIEVSPWILTAIRGIRPDTAEHAHSEHDGVITVAVAWGGDGYDEIAPAPTKRETSSFEELEARRIAAGRPRFGVDVTDEMLINETPYLSRAVSFAKGCYPGQESVARVHNLGRVRRRIVGVTLRAPVSAGDPLMEGDLEVGRVTSVASEHAIATVRATAHDVIAGGAPATLRDLG